MKSTDLREMEKKEEKEMGLIEYIKRTKRVQRELISIAVIIAILLAMVAVIVYQGKKVKTREAEIEELKRQVEEILVNPIVVNPVSPEIVLQTASEEIKEIGELITAEYLYTNAARFTDSKEVFGFTVPGTKKGFTMMWDGVIKAGVDIEKIYVARGDEEYSIKVFLPEAEILASDVFEESVEVLDEKSGLFNPIRVEDKVEFDQKTEETMKQRAIENGLLEQAQENAETVLTRLLNANPDIKKDYTVEFEIISDGE